MSPRKIHHDGRARQELTTPKKFIFFGSDSEKTLFEAEPPGCFLKQKQITSNRDFRPFGTRGI
jgi:hypothetical protein